MPGSRRGPKRPSLIDRALASGKQLPSWSPKGGRLPPGRSIPISPVGPRRPPRAPEMVHPGPRRFPLDPAIELGQTGAPREPVPTGPYQGAAGSELDHPGQQRVPMPDWADPSSPNYERRNYYQLPDGSIIAREPGYYNPDNPYDTGRPGEVNKEFMQRYGGWNPDFERRVDEPGITPWGPGGKASPAGPFEAPGPGRGAAQQRVPHRFLDALLEPRSPLEMGGRERFNQAGDPTQSLMLALADLYKRLPGRQMRGRLPAE